VEEGERSRQEEGFGLCCEVRDAVGLLLIIKQAKHWIGVLGYLDRTKLLDWEEIFGLGAARNAALRFTAVSPGGYG
jgi:hypothetical protein